MAKVEEGDGFSFPQYVTFLSKPCLRRRLPCKHEMYLYDRGPFSFTYTNHVRTYLAVRNHARAGPPAEVVGTAGIIIALSDGPVPTPHVLLIKRVPHPPTSLRPNPPEGKWEPPGGGVENWDKDMLTGCAREVKEETGLTVTKFIAACQEGYGFTTSKGLKCWKVCFVVEVEECGTAHSLSSPGVDLSQVPVKLDPEEHTDYAWVREEELRTDGGNWPITSQEQLEDIKRAFKLFKLNPRPSVAY